MTDKQFRAVAHAILANLGSTGDEPQVAFMTGALMAMHDIGASSSAQENLKPSDQGRKLVHEMAGRWS